MIGLCVGLTYQQRFPSHSVVILEKNAFLGDETSGRNSGVLHAGIYYPHNSLKALFCLEGRPLWEEYLTQKSLPWKKCGKYIVARDDQESHHLEKIKASAEQCGANGLRMATKDELNDLSKKFHIKNAIYSDNTGVMDVATALAALRDDFERNQGVVLLNRNAIIINVGTTLNSAQNFQVETADEIVCPEIVINCAGLNAVGIRKQLGLHELSDHWVKGHYLSTTQKLDYERHIYPLPLKNLHGLGVHATIDPYGNVKFGPDTLDVDKLSYELPLDRLKSMTEATRSLFKNIDESRLYLDYAGIRPKIKKEGELYLDFWVKGPRDHMVPGYFECCGIESPGLTSSFALAKYLVGLI